MNDQRLQCRDDYGGNGRGAPRWLRALAFLAACVAISGSNCIFGPVLNGGADKASGSAVAGTSVWTTNGPYGGQLRSVAIDPVSSATVYAAGIGGVFKSVDGGTTWAPASTGITRYDPYIIVNAVVISPGNHNTLLFAAA